MVKRLLLMVAILSGVMLVARAQDASPTPTAAPFPEADREIYTVLHRGDNAFDPEEWYASAEELPSRTRATWRSDTLGGLAFADYIHFDEGIVFEQLDAVFNQDWWDVTLGGTYSVWRENVRCDLGDLRLIEFSVQANDVSYNMRYWIQPIGRFRVLAFFIVLPADNPDIINDYADRLYPQLSSCTGSIG
jgi:hypothetical protein